MPRTMPTQPARPDYSDRYSSPDFAVHEHGQCDDGSFIRSYVPARPYRDTDGRMKAVVYLHGFCLGAAEIYQSHLVHLARQGYHVFFPSYQRGFCRYGDSLPTTMGDLTQALFRPFPISPRGWLGSAIASVAGAYGRAQLTDAPVDTYLFGHSLGGLFALSWPAYAVEKVPAGLMPRQVIAANPIPDSESLIPTPIRITGRIIGAYADRVDIIETGGALRVPVAILHGAGDILVPPKAWERPLGAIASAEKRLYLSQSDSHGAPPLVADHIQAGVDTSFIPDVMAMMSVGGVAREDNLNWRYIWHALDQVIRYGARADQLQFDMGAWSDGVPVKPVI
ncbi:lysophospholipase [Oscillochloris sp. ZM17-4]|uniref:alpha/beta hydrolase n=1 Tax=Oscillochloris sp. ZM17-4 TaxID=2866714 RepID=UPI001C73B94C|nr:alpha/beta hydrolase [Oscillochloris sp. ZM17-4]MBX0330261.1 lysophospholipase [Oscillochloris sp. ZM17-4]